METLVDLPRPPGDGDRGDIGAGTGAAGTLLAEYLMKFPTQSEQKELFGAAFTQHFLSSPRAVPAAL